MLLSIDHAKLLFNCICSNWRGSWCVAFVAFATAVLRVLRVLRMMCMC